MGQELVIWSVQVAHCSTQIQEGGVATVGEMILLN